MTELDERIKTMKETGAISEDTANQIDELRLLFLRRFGIQLTEENASACVTHMCFALERIARGEGITPVAEAVRDEILHDPRYDAACFITDHIFRKISALTEAERDYLIVHVIVLLNKICEDYDREVLT